MLTINKYYTESEFPRLTRDKLITLQVNLGYLCNQTCKHCHVDAGPNRQEVMDKKTIDEILLFLEKSNASILDLTGGAPELNPYFTYIVTEAKRMGKHIIDRCNLTVLNEPGMDYMIDFLFTNKVEIIASMPCYTEENVDNQRGNGVFRKSIQSLIALNQAGYSKENNPELNLVFNPLGPSLPSAQEKLEEDYKKELYKKYGITFNHLYTMTNMPINRFGRKLAANHQLTDYIDLLKANYKSDNLNNVMCKTLISIDWQGFVYDCDFNQMLNLNLGDKGKIHITELENDSLYNKEIAVREHCFGCTAGAGSSCGGALT